VRGGAPRSARSYGGGPELGSESAQRQQAAAASGRPPIIPARGYGQDYDDFDEYEYADQGGRPPRKRRRALLVTAGLAVLVAAVAAALVFTGTVSVPGISAKPVADRRLLPQRLRRRLERHPDGRRVPDGLAEREPAGRRQHHGQPDRGADPADRVKNDLRSAA